MALSLSTTRSAAGLSRQPAPTRRRVCAPPPRAGLADVFAPILKIFSKADDAVSTGNTGFSGSISHHGAGKPFKDGYANTSAAAKAAAQQVGVCVCVCPKGALRVCRSSLPTLSEAVDRDVVLSHSVYSHAFRLLTRATAFSGAQLCPLAAARASGSWTARLSFLDVRSTANPPTLFHAVQKAVLCLAMYSCGSLTCHEPCPTPPTGLR